MQDADKMLNCKCFCKNDFCQTPGLVLSLSGDFVLPLSQEQEQQEPPLQKKK